MLMMPEQLRSNSSLIAVNYKHSHLHLVPVDKHDDISQFIAPAILSYNNAPFKKEDWKSIQSLQLSGKAKNPHKVGKFGIGFNSVYHITGKLIFY